jgi:hypothetical protein
MADHIGSIVTHPQLDLASVRRRAPFLAAVTIAMHGPYRTGHARIAPRLASPLLPFSSDFFVARRYWDTPAHS